MKPLESRNYVATEADIAELAKTLIDATQHTESGKATYLKALVATAQKELGLEPRVRAARAEPETPMDDQLRAVQTVHERFYAAVLAAVVTPDIAKAPRLSLPERQRRALERNRRSTFARTAKATLTGWIRAGHDIAILVPARVSKALLQLETPRTRRRAVSPALLRRTAVERSARAFESLKALTAADAEAGATLISEVIARLTRLVRGEPKRRGPPVPVKRTAAGATIN